MILKSLLDIVRLAQRKPLGLARGGAVGVILT